MRRARFPFMMWRPEFISTLLLAPSLLRNSIHTSVPVLMLMVKTLPLWSSLLSHRLDLGQSKYWRFGFSQVSLQIKSFFAPNNESYSTSIIPKHNNIIWKMSNMYSQIIMAIWVFHWSKGLPWQFFYIYIFRPPKPNSSVLPDIHGLLTSLCTMSSNIVIIGDVNVHVDNPSCRSATEFLAMLESLGLQPHVKVPTHT